MSSWGTKTWDNKLYWSWRESDDLISVVVNTTEEARNVGTPDVGGCFYLTYKEFMQLANFLGFDIKPRDYRMELSSIEASGEKR